MAIHQYGKIKEGRRQKLRKRITAGVTALILILVAAWIIGVLAGNGDGYQFHKSLAQQNDELLEQISTLQDQITDLQNQLAAKDGVIAEKDAQISAIPTPAPYIPAEQTLPMTATEQNTSPRQ